MRLTRFRVTNFRSVIDSGWIDAERVTALVGVNESGKTNLLLPLWKLNPAREGEIKPTSDYPKANYAAVRENPGDFKFIAAEFLTEKHADELAKRSGVDRAALEVVRVSRDFSKDYYVEFPLFNPTSALSKIAVAKILNEARKEIHSISALAKEVAIKPAMLAALDLTIAEVNSLENVSLPILLTLSTRLKQTVPEPPAPTSSIVPRLNRLLEALSEMEASLRTPPPEDKEDVVDYILENLPRFVYYSNYGNLDSEIYLPHVVENLKRQDLGAKEAAKARTLRVLFSFVRLSPEEILQLGRDFRHPEGRKPNEAEIAEIATKKRERTILLNSAGTDLTKRFQDWWKQGNYTFEFQADGDHFRIWVSDSKRPEKVELEDRSSGLQWFLSFYLIFLVESSRDHRDAILLLDEPGLSLHPLAQKDLAAFFENLANNNQLIYTTHSPFLVDADMLDRARKVYVATDGSTKSSSDLRQGNDDPRKAGATYAIYSALNMNVAESLLLGCRPVIVEGPSDQHYLSTIKILVIAKKLISPSREIVFPPAHGAKNAKVVASILTGRDEALPIMLLDGDEAGRKASTDMQNGLYQHAKSRVLSTNSYIAFGDSEVEDLFPPVFFADVVDRWERRPSNSFSDAIQPGKPVVPQLEEWARREGVALVDGWKVDLAREVKKRALAMGPDKFDGVDLARWAKLFSDFEVE